MRRTEVENPLALEHQVCFALAIASRSVIALYRPTLEPIGLTHAQYPVMLALWESEPVRNASARARDAVRCSNASRPQA